MRNARRVPSPRALLAVGLLTTAAALSVATSKRPEPTHKPVYLGWFAFRTTAVRVEPPRKIQRRGKLLVHGHWLVVSEPNQGFHLVDNRDRKKPRPVAFVRVPGNVDLATRGKRLYADSFVDLLVFELTDEAPHVALVKRVKDVFPYDPYQTLPQGTRIFPGRVSRENGVVVSWKPIRRKHK